MRISLFAFFFGLLALLSCQPDSPANGGGEGEPRSQKAPLIERAIAAHGGEERLASVQRVRTVSLSRERGRERRSILTTALPKRFHFQSDTGLAEIVIATDGETIWRTLDGYRMEPDSGDERIVTQHLLQMEMALLVGLSAHKDARIKERGEDKGLEWLEVTFNDEGYGPYRLGFAKDSSLLMRIDWREELPGGSGALDLSLFLSDYRDVDGVRTAWKGQFQKGEMVLLENEAEQIAWNEPVSDALFQAPPEPEKEETATGMRARVVTRTCPALQVARIEAKGRGAGDLERRLTNWVQEKRLVRAGPTLHELEGETLKSIAIPVAVPLEALKPSEDGEPALAVLPPEKVRSLALKLEDPYARGALKPGLAALWPESAPDKKDERLRLISWPGSLIQIQRLGAE